MSYPAISVYARYRCLWVFVLSLWLFFLPLLFCMCWCGAVRCKTDAELCDTLRLDKAENILFVFGVDFDVASNESQNQFFPVFLAALVMRPKQLNCGRLYEISLKSHWNLVYGSNTERTYWKLFWAKSIGSSILIRKLFPIGLSIVSERLDAANLRSNGARWVTQKYLRNFNNVLILLAIHASNVWGPFKSFDSFRFRQFRRCLIIADSKEMKNLFGPTSSKIWISNFQRWWGYECFMDGCRQSFGLQSLQETHSQPCRTEAYRIHSNWFSAKLLQASEVVEF